MQTTYLQKLRFHLIVSKMRSHGDEPCLDFVADFLESSSLLNFTTFAQLASAIDRGLKLSQPHLYCKETVSATLSLLGSIQAQWCCKLNANTQPTYNSLFGGLSFSVTDYSQ